MPTPDPSMSGNRRGARGLREAPGVARRTGVASGRYALAASLLLAGVLASACADAPAVDPDVREGVAAQRLAEARRVASATLPPGALEVARAGWVEAGAGASRAASPLSNTFTGVDELARAALADLEAGRGDALWALALTRQEFEGVVWPVLPASRPERNTPFEYIWGDLQQKSSDSLSATLNRYGGRHYELVRVAFAGETRSYGSFLVHGDARLLVTDATGAQQELDLFGSVIERDGRYKVFSWVTD